MIFLIVYDRKTQQLMRDIEVFEDSSRSDAYQRRLEAELALPTDAGRYEVVLLEAESRQVIERTHARYFFGVTALVESAKAELTKMSERVREKERKRSTS